MQGTRRRAVPMTMLGLVSIGVLHYLVSAGVMAVNFTTTDQKFQIYSNYMQGDYGALHMASNAGYSSASSVGVAEVGFKVAKLSGLCAIVHEDFAGLTSSLIITAGAPVAGSFNSKQLVTADGRGTPIQLAADGTLSGSSLSGAVEVQDFFLNTTSIGAYGNKISGLNLGENAPDAGSSVGIDYPAGGSTLPQQGAFGLSANRLNLGGLAGDTYGINLAGQVHLPLLKMTAVPGAADQTSCPGAAQ